jgi:hypothetical protein
MKTTKKNRALSRSLAAIALTGAAFSAMAAPVPYANPGTENVIEYSFTAIGTGAINAYFVSKGEADYTNTVGISVNGVETGVFGLNNQTSSYGQAFNLGFANAGDSVVFTIRVADIGRDFSSDKSLNIDGVNHVYSSAYGGDQFIPAGLYVAFEDLKGVDFPQDFDYIDLQIVVSNVGSPVVTPEVPLPAAAWLFGSALVGLAGTARRRS